MDPNEALKNLREELSYFEGGAFAEQFQALDEWLAKGGALPEAWQKMRTELAPERARVGIKPAIDELLAGLRTLNALDSLRQIHELVSGNEYSSDLLDAISAVLTRAGYEVLEPEDPEHEKEADDDR